MSIATLDMTSVQRQISDDGKTLHVHIPIQLKRRGGRKEVVMPGGSEFAPLQNHPVVIALARAHRWNDLLETGRVSSINELADHNQVDPAYISRFLRLTILAPDITEAILNGQEPSGLSLAKLIKDVPATWEGQRECFIMGNRK